MPIYKLQGPDGKVYTIEGPEGATADQLGAFITSQNSDRQAKIAAQQATDRDLYSPTNGMSTMDKIMAGAGKAVSDTGMGLQQVGAGVADFLSPRQQNLSSLVTGKKTLSRVEELRNQVADTRARDTALMNTGAGLAGNIGGNLAMALLPGGVVAGAGKALTKVPQAAELAQALMSGGRAMMAPTSLPTAAGVGAAQGAIQPSVSTDETLGNMAMGAGAGAAGNVVGKMIAPNTSASVRTLMDEGVRPTIGQLVGGRAKALEDKLTSVPILGDAITSARRGAVEDLNRAAYNRALAPIGQQATGDVGRAGVADVSSQLGNAYGDVLPNIRFTPDQQYIQDVASVLNRGSQTLPDAQNAQLSRIADAQLFGKINGPMTGVELKPIQSELNTISRGMRGDPSYDTRTLGGLVDDLNQTTRDAVMRSTPEEAARLADIDRGYGQYAVIRNAAGRTGSANGVFSPEALQAAVRAGDKSVAKGNFARGTANMQDLSDAAVDVLGRGYPDSGTAGRLLLSGGGLGGAIAAGVPGALSTGAILGGVSAPYLPVTRQLAALLIAGERPKALQNIAPLVRALGTGGAASTPLLLNAREQQPLQP